MAEALKDRSMVLQKEMIAEHFERLERAPRPASRWSTPSFPATWRS